MIRIEKYIKSKYPFLSYGLISKFIRKKDISVNGERVEFGYKIKLNEGSNKPQEEIYFSNFFRKIVMLEHEKFKNSLIDNAVNNLLDNKDINSSSYTQKEIENFTNKAIRENLLYEDDNFIAIYKESSISVQGGSNVRISISDGLKFLNQQNIKNNVNEICEYKLVHRLDKDTSGILLIAKNYSSANILTGHFKKRTIKKQYLSINIDLSRDKQGGEEFMNQDNKIREISDYIDDKEAITRYKILDLKEYSKDSDVIRLALIKFSPITGRKHQLRIHSNKMKMPILGEVKYDRLITRELKRRCKRIFNENVIDIKYKKLYLHAYKVEIPEEIFGKKITISAPIPSYFGKLLDREDLKFK